MRSPVANAIDTKVQNLPASSGSFSFGFYGYFGYAYFGRRCPLAGES